jgi:hypothetical protein
MNFTTNMNPKLIKNNYFITKKLKILLIIYSFGKESHLNGSIFPVNENINKSDNLFFYSNFNIFLVSLNPVPSSV